MTPLAPPPAPPRPARYPFCGIPAVALALLTLGLETHLAYVGVSAGEGGGEVTLTALALGGPFVLLAGGLPACLLALAAHLRGGVERRLSRLALAGVAGAVLVYATFWILIVV